MKIIISLVFLVTLSACSSQSIMPDRAEVKVSREAADKDCREVGKVLGSSVSAKATKEEVLEDLKQAAADKGANYVVIKQWSSTGTRVNGTAYQCD